MVVLNGRDYIIWVVLNGRDYLVLVVLNDRLHIFGFLNGRDYIVLVVRNGRDSIVLVVLNGRDSIFFCPSEWQGLHRVEAILNADDLTRHSFEDYLLTQNNKGRPVTTKSTGDSLR